MVEFILNKTIRYQKLFKQEKYNYEILNLKALDNRIQECSENILNNNNICECSEPCGDIEPCGDDEIRPCIDDDF